MLAVATALYDKLHHLAELGPAARIAQRAYRAHVGRGLLALSKHQVKTQEQRFPTPDFRRMQFNPHATRRTPHSASLLVQAMSAWLVNTRRAPSRRSRDARVYGHTTTAMHKLNTAAPLCRGGGICSWNYVRPPLARRGKLHTALFMAHFFCFFLSMIRGR